MKVLAEQITRAFHSEQSANLPAVHASDIPVCYEAITPEWLTNILCINMPAARVIDYRLGAPEDGNANRRRIFIEYNQAGIDAALPASIFCKASQKLANRLVLASLGLITGEISFYKDYRSALDIEAPNCFWANYDTESFNSIIMLNDLEAAGAVFCNHDTDMTRARTESQLGLLAKLHGRYYNSREVRKATLPTFEDIFHKNEKWFDIERCCWNGFSQAELVIPQRLFKQRDDIWAATLKAVALHSESPPTLTHIDPHLRNWYITAADEMGLCDWQTFGIGHWGRDLAYTISTALTTENRRLWERELLKFYIEQFAQAGGSRIKFDEIWEVYRQQLFAALAWWTLTLTPSSGSSQEAPPDFQPEDACLAFIGRMTTAIDDLDALNSFV